MAPMMALVGCGIAAAVGAVPALRSPAVGRRLARLDAAAAPPTAARSRVLVAATSGLAVAGMIGRWWGVPVGVVAGYAIERFLRRREPAEVKEARQRAAADLPLGADLLAAALKAGSPADRAAAAVADALGGPLGVRLERVARS